MFGELMLERFAMGDTRCPFCDHVFATEEVVDEWCAACGRHIPEVLLKELRPKPHIRNPHPHPLPPPTPAAEAAKDHETKVRFVGLLLMLAAVVVGVAAFGWGAYTQMTSREIGLVSWVGGGFALAVFLVGVVMLTRGQGGGEE